LQAVEADNAERVGRVAQPLAERAQRVLLGNVLGEEVIDELL
jgi:hypothetical protein